MRIARLKKRAVNVDRDVYGGEPKTGLYDDTCAYGNALLLGLG